MKKKLFITIAVWGKEYIATFVNYSLATQLSRGNIPALVSFCDVTYQIITTLEDKGWLEQQPLVHQLEKLCRIEWQIIDELFPPTGDDGEKYFFLSALQNYSMHSAIGHDYLVFNYADFIWADTGLYNIIKDFADSTDAVLSYCMRVDHSQATEVLKNAADANGIIELAPRRAVDMALTCMHRETRLAFWDDEKFTVTPSAVLWPVGEEGVVITAYHQTILALRVKPQDPLYYNGILTTSLDGYYSAVLAANHTIVHATNSDVFFAVSLSGDMSDSSIGGLSRPHWDNYTREDSMRDLLRGKVSEGQRAFALKPIEIRRDYKDSALWNSVKANACAILEKFDRETPFDVDFYNDLYGMTGAMRLPAPLPLVQPAAPAAPQEPPPSTPSLVRRTYRLARKSIGLLRRMVRERRIPVRTIRRMIAHSRAIALLYIKQAFKNMRAPQQAQPMPQIRNEMLDTERCLELLYLGEIDHLLAHAPKYIPPIKIRKKDILDKTAAAYYEIGLLPEKVISSSDNASYLMRILRFAEKALRETTRRAPLFIEGQKALARNLWFQGRPKEALQQFQQAETQRLKLIETLGLDPNAALLLPSNCGHVIGLMGHLDSFIKSKMLHGDTRPYHLVVPKNEIVNKAFFDYWKPFLELHYPTLPGVEKSTMDMAYGADWNWAIPQNNSSMAHVHTALARTQREWHKQHRKPLLHLKAEHQQQLDQFKAAYGMKKDDWFVCLHVRSSGFYGDKTNSAQDFRNTPLIDYYEAIEAVVKAGGWVIRMGDPSMPKLQWMDDTIDRTKVIDYAHSNERSAELDVALCASCELFISSPSGLHTVAHAFGQPVCYVNFPIYAGFPWHPGEIFIPKLYYSLARHRVLSMEEILSSDLVHADHWHLLAKDGIALLRNTPDEIAQTVMEALKGARYDMRDKQDGEAARAAFQTLNQKYSRDISGQLGLYFVNKHKNILFPALFNHALEEDNAHQKIRYSYS